MFSIHSHSLLAGQKDSIRFTCEGYNSPWVLEACV